MVRKHSRRDIKRRSAADNGVSATCRRGIMGELNGIVHEDDVHRKAHAAPFDGRISLETHHVTSAHFANKVLS